MRKIIVFVLVMVLGCFTFLPTSDVSAHSGDVLSAWAVVTPTIDGVISWGEWDDADFHTEYVYGYNGERHSMGLYVKNDADYLYLAVSVNDEYSDPAEMGYDFLNFDFDNDHDGVCEIGDDGMAIRFDGAVIEDIFNPTGVEGWAYSDDDYGGTNDITAAISHSNPVPNGNGRYIAEYQKPLDSTDDTHDFSLSLGDTVGFSFTLADGDPWPGPTGAFTWPWGGASGYADIIIASSPNTADIKSAINNLPDDAFKNNPSQRKNSLGNQLDAVQNMIDNGDYDGAIDKLEVIREKMDGCYGGNPNNDWITDCGAQAEIIELIDLLIAYLETL